MFQKRHIVLATLVLALGTAVYVNWRYTSNETLREASASTASVSGNLGDVLYVNGEVNRAPSSGSAESGMSSGGAASARLTEAALSRQKARDEATDLLKSILAAAEQSDEAKKEAVKQAAALAAAIEQESKIESLLKAKGYEHCLAFVDGDKANIMVQSDGLLANETITIKDIVHNQSNIAYENIIIVETK